MKCIKITLENKDGSTYFIVDVNQISKILTSIPKDVKWLKSDITDIRAKYFVIISEICKNTRLGYSKSELHNAFKPFIFKRLKEFPNLFINNTYVESTTALTYEGWKQYIEELKDVANDILGYAVV